MQSLMRFTAPARGPLTPIVESVGEGEEVAGGCSVGHYLNCFSLHKRVTRVIIAPVKVTYNATSNRLGKTN